MFENAAKSGKTQSMHISGSENVFPAKCLQKGGSMKSSNVMHSIAAKKSGKMQRGLFPNEKMYS